MANFGGTIWQAIMGLVFIPLYIKFMGIEAWGLVGFFTTLQVVFNLLDLGLSNTLNREMARLSVLPGKEEEMRNLARTLEVIYWVVAVLAGILIISLSPFIADHWIQARQLSHGTVKVALISMGVVTAFQMPIGLYTGGLMGLEKQVLLNEINVARSTARGGGAVLILWLVSPTVEAFFSWQIVVAAVNVFVLAAFFWRMLPVVQNKPSFQRRLFLGVWKFAAGMSGITALAVILTQMDKVILSKMLSLKVFGYYMVASTVAMSLTRFTGPVMSAVYPRLTKLFSAEDEAGLSGLYHKSCQLMSILVLPVAVTVCLFSREILFVWTQSPLLSDRTYLIVSILTDAARNVTRKAPRI